MKRGKNTYGEDSTNEKIHMEGLVYTRLLAHNDTQCMSVTTLHPTLTR